MKRIALVMFLAVMASLTSCKNDTKQTSEDSNTDVMETSKPVAKENITTTTKKSSFDINSIPVSTAELGDIPFFSFPKGYASQNSPSKKSYDMLFFPIDGIMTPMEGKIWKTNIVTADDNDEDWSLVFFKKSYDDAITSAGGVKIFDGKVSREEMDRIEDEATYFGEQGSIDYWNDPVRVYAIHRQNGDNIFIQLSGNSASGDIQILQTAPFKQTIKLLKSDQIQKDLKEKGKSVLHINFDTDKATLKPDGKEAVAEISKALQSDNALNISINGYTDNTGDDAHNFQLSKDRAAAVKTAIIASGIDAKRLDSTGFGSKNPIADNSTDDGKTQNRRVELVKK